MRYKLFGTSVMISVGLLLAAGCATTTPTDEEAATTDEAVVQPTDSAPTVEGEGTLYSQPGDYQIAGGGAPQPYDSGARSSRTAGPPGAENMERVIYFDYDSFEIRPDARPVVETNARYLLSNPTVSATLEGNTDERGSREYNVALGERRAEAVRRAMSAFGVPRQQLNVISYGEERPAVAGQTEEAYALNRRVEIAY